ncbi:MAG: hypothetical protein GY898_32045 [Proteobacteria bacterium]|nr:hypothetical protein [Pseudomonadota bacterium]
MRSYLLLCVVLAVSGCAPESNEFVESEDSETPGDEDPTPDDTPPAKEDGVAGKVIDRATGDGIANVSVNGEITAEDGTFITLPTSWDPTMLLATADGYISWWSVFDLATWFATGPPLEIATWTTAGGLAWHEELADSEWDEGLGVLIVDFRTSSPEVAEGLIADIPGDSVAVFTWDADGAPVGSGMIPANPAKTWVLFTGVAPGDTTVTLTLHDGMVCSGPSTVDVMPRTVTQLIYLCEGE